MGTTISYTEDRLRNSYWFVPTLMLIGAAALAWVTTNLDDSYNPERARWVGDLIHSGSSDGAREVLGTIAASMITVAGVVFSVTIVSLQLASSQFGPRMLANFMRDRGNQITLGTFVSAFLYSLLVLRTIDTSSASANVPHLSVTFAVGLAVAGLVVLIYFIHHISTAIQAPNLIDAIADEMRRGVDHLFPDVEDIDVADTTHTAELPADFDEHARPIEAGGTGFVEVVDVEDLVKIAAERDLVIRLEVRPGRFVVQRTPVASAYPAGHMSDDVAEAIARTIVTGARRTAQHDIEFPIRQMVEIAVRALSPAINDPFTASTCVDQAGSGLCELARRRFPGPYVLDKDDRLRFVDGDPITWERLIGAAFDQVRQAASSHTQVYLHMLESLTRVARCVRDPARLEPLLREASLIVEAAGRHVEAEVDRAVIEQRYDALVTVAGRARDGLVS
ncbi:MAG TPA: DUF2254 domain-containing protein [Nocardioidaceae bacterium]|nr:DUF2254 domain-containing protein [Nocardioidaceae bacterium]